MIARSSAGLLELGRWELGRLGGCFDIGLDNKPKTELRQFEGYALTADYHSPTRLDAAKQRKTPGSFLPGVLFESYQTIGIRSYAERER
jgi:hypothetical protein